MNQAQRIIEKCGGGDFGVGVKVVAEITGVHSSRIHRWTYPKDRGGTGGIIPAQHHQPILDGARDRHLKLKPDDFFDDLAAPSTPDPREVTA